MWPFPDFTTPPAWYMTYWTGLFAAYCLFWTWIYRRR